MSPAPIYLGDGIVYLNNLWSSETLIARICQIVFVISVIGIIRDFSKHPGRVSSRYVKRTFIILAFVIGLFIPWDDMNTQMDLGTKIVLTVLGLITWVAAVGLLFADEDPTLSTTPATQATPLVTPIPETPIAAPATPVTKVKVGTGICSSCGTKNPTAGNYCKRCGTQL